jgi:predicted nucleic acid-binding protein
MSYWDTSTLVKLYAQEPDSAAFESYALNAPAKAVTSRIALYEARATFQRKEAQSILQPGCAQKLYSQLMQDVAAGELRLVELGVDVEREYGQVLSQCYQQTPAIPLRTLDVLHLASARVAGETKVVATDKRMRDPAKLLGLSLFPVWDDGAPPRPATRKMKGLGQGPARC